MNFCALDNALAYIENGYINEEFIMNDMLKSIQCIDESIEAITESESFFEKAKATIKKVIEAIGKFFSNIWKKFKSWFTETVKKAKTAAAQLALKLKAATDKDFKDFLYNNKVYEMPVDFYKTIDVLLSSYASTTETIKDPAEYITNNLTHKKAAAVEAAELYVKFIDDSTRVEAELDKRVEDLKKTKEDLTATIKKLDAIAKLSPLESKKALVKLLDDKNAKIVLGEPQPGLMLPPEAAAESLIKKDELKRVNNCLKVSTEVINVAYKELKKTNAIYDSMEETMAKKLAGDKI